MKEHLFSEVIKLKDGIFYNLPYHEDRMKRTMNYFFGTEVSLDSLSDIVPENKKMGLYKCRIVYSDKINSVEFSPYLFRQIRNIQLVYDNTIDYSYKYTDRSCFNKLLEQNDCDEVVFVKNGYVTDASFANLIFEDNTGLYTPTTYLLRGTKRESLLYKGIIQERIIRDIDIKNYDAVYLINAMIDIEDEIKVETDKFK